VRVSENGIRVLQYFEDCKLEAYPDPGTGGEPWTIGWGHTGDDVVPGLVWSQERADSQLRTDLEERELAVNNFVTCVMKQGQFDALALFAYNAGIPALGNSTLLRLFNEGDDNGAKKQFARWNKSKGNVLRGLTRRRAAEAALFQGLTGEQAIAVGKAAA
jgi:lysozyme